LAIVTIFSVEYKQQFSEYVSLLFYLAKRSETTVEERVEKVCAMTEAYFKHVGKHADWAQLDRLGSLILRDELTDTDRMKSRNNEFPILSEDQIQRRDAETIPLKWADEVGVDGRDHRPRTRDSMRKLREISGYY
jgi:hypothetical protein